MTGALEIFSVLCIALTLAAVGISLSLAGESGGGYETAIIESRYIHKIYDSFVRPHTVSQPVTLPRSGRRTARRTLARLLARLEDRTVFHDPEGVEELAAVTGIGRYLSAYFPPFSRSSRYAAAARLPLEERAVRRLRRASRLLGRGAGLQALAAAAANNPHDPLETIAAYRRTIPIRNLLEIRDLLLRRGARLDYEECLGSPSAALNIMGLSLIGDFQISEAEESVYRMLASRNRQVVKTALFTLALLHGSLSDKRVGTAVAAMPPAERMAQYRIFIRRGYSLAALRGILAFEKNMESGLDKAVSGTVHSRKRSLGHPVTAEIE